MTAENAQQLRRRLRAFGLSNAAIAAAWPRWWSEAAEISTSARTDLRFSLARNLGLDPRTLLDEREQPRSVWHEQARFKRLTAETAIERDAIAAFGRALATVLVAATPSPTSILGVPASELRAAVLGAGTPYVRLLDLLSLSWSAGIPVVHLRVFPRPNKRMAAMTVRVNNRYAILLAKDSVYPAVVAFYLAHEIGHVSLDHFRNEPVIVHLDDDVPGMSTGDAEEEAADGFALELLTGQPRPIVLPEHDLYSAKELARVALSSAQGLGVEPGVLALCFGYSTKDWPTANAALRIIYTSRKPVWREVNQVARNQLPSDNLPSDALDYVGAVLGLPTE